MGNSVSGSSSIENEEETIKYPLTEGELTPRNTNITALYTDITPEYAEKIILSLPGLNNTNDYTIIIKNINTTLVIGGRFSKVAWGSPALDEETPEDAEPEVKLSTFKEDGTLLILSTCINAAKSSRKEGLFITRTMDEPNLPEIFLSTVDHGDKKFYDGVIIDDYTDLKAPADIDWLTKALRIKLFEQDDTIVPVLSINLSSYQINHKYRELNTYIIVCKTPSPAKLVRTLRSIGQRSSVLTIFNIQGANEFTAEVFEAFGLYMASKYMKIFDYRDTIYLFNGFISAFKVTFRGANVDLNGHSENFHLIADKKKIAVVSNYYGIINREYFFVGDKKMTNPPPDVYGVQIIDYAPSTIQQTKSFVYDLYYTYIGDEDLFMVSLLARIERMEQKFIFALKDKPDDFLLNQLNKNADIKVLTVKGHHYITNVLNYDANNSIFEDSWYMVGIDVDAAKHFKYDALVTDTGGIKFLRKGGYHKSKENVFIGMQKLNTTGYYITKPMLTLPDSINSNNQFKIFSSRETNQDLLIDFARMMVHQYKQTEWCFISTTPIMLDDHENFTVIKTNAHDVEILVPKKSLEVFSIEDDQIVVNKNPATSIDINKAISPAGISTAKSTIKAPYAMDPNSGMPYFIKPGVLNISLITDEMIGGPLGKIIFGVNKVFIHSPEVNTLAISDLKDSAIYTVVYDVPSHFIQAFAEMMDKLISRNSELRFITVFGYDSSVELKNISTGKILKAINEDEKNMIVFGPEGLMVSRNKISMTDYPDLIFNTKILNGSTRLSDYYESIIILPTFTAIQEKQVDIHFGMCFNMTSIMSALPFTDVGKNKISLTCLPITKKDEYDKYSISPTLIDDPSEIVATFVHSNWVHTYSFLKNLRRLKILSSENKNKFVILVKFRETLFNIRMPCLLRGLKEEFPDLKVVDFSRVNGLYSFTNLPILVTDDSLVIGRHTLYVTHQLAALRPHDVILNTRTNVFQPKDPNTIIKYGSVAYMRTAHIYLQEKIQTFFLTVTRQVTLEGVMSVLVLPIIDATEAANIDTLYGHFPSSTVQIVIVARVSNMITTTLKNSSYIDGLFVCCSPRYTRNVVMKKLTPERRGYEVEIVDYMHKYRFKLWENTIPGEKVKEDERDSILSRLSDFDFIVNTVGVGLDYMNEMKVLANTNASVVKNLVIYNNIGHGLGVFERYVNGTNNHIVVLRRLNLELSNQSSVLGISLRGPNTNLFFNEVLSFCTQVSQKYDKVVAIVIHSPHPLVGAPRDSSSFVFGNYILHENKLVEWNGVWVFKLSVFTRQRKNFIQLSQTMQYVSERPDAEFIDRLTHTHAHGFASTTATINTQDVVFGKTKFIVKQFAHPS